MDCLRLDEKSLVIKAYFTKKCIKYFIKGTAYMGFFVCFFLTIFNEETI